MKKYLDRLNDNQSQEFADKVGDVFKTLPKLPRGLVEFFVKVSPYLALLGAILSLISSPVLGLLTIMTLITLNPLIVITTLISAVLALVVAVILFMAYNPLKNRQQSGWMFLFWVTIINAVQTALGLVYSPSGIIGSLVFLAISFYVLFQMRPWYKSTGKVVAEA